jgi:transcriptional regulator with PAS, ATPase and Fis domain
LIVKRSYVEAETPARPDVQVSSIQDEKEPESAMFVSAAPGIREMLERVDRIARSPAPVFITGESGTGKEVIARLVHEKSNARGRPWVAVNCAALPRDVVENELFGHEPEAFTGASSRRVGCFELANGGTLFLDEIAEVHPQVQAKLLRASELKTIRRLGGSKDIQVNVRIVAATNKNPQEAIARGELRPDLYYRLSVLEIHLTPLRDRRCDIPLLLDHFLVHFSKMYERPLLRLTPAAAELLMAYDWPGNVRELRNLIESLVLICPSDVIDLHHLPQRMSNIPLTREMLELPAGLSLDEVERRYILHTLNAEGRNKAQAARVLGISRKSLYDRLKQGTTSAEQDVPDVLGDGPCRAD